MLRPDDFESLKPIEAEARYSGMNRVDDPGVAWDMAYAEKPFWDAYLKGGDEVTLDYYWNTVAFSDAIEQARDGHPDIVGLQLALGGTTVNSVLSSYNLWQGQANAREKNPDMKGIASPHTIEGYKKDLAKMMTIWRQSIEEMSDGQLSELYRDAMAKGAKKNKKDPANKAADERLAQCSASGEVDLAMLRDVLAGQPEEEKEADFTQDDYTLMKFMHWAKNGRIRRAKSINPNGELIKTMAGDQDRLNIVEALEYAANGPRGGNDRQVEKPDTAFEMALEDAKFWDKWGEYLGAEDIKGVMEDALVTARVAAFGQEESDEELRNDALKVAKNFLSLHPKGDLIIADYRKSARASTAIELASKE